jgi:hypothetical protein
VLAEHSKSSERTVFWDDDLGANVDPFKGVDGGFFAADWDTKVCLSIALFLYLCRMRSIFLAQSFAPIG